MQVLIENNRKRSKISLTFQLQIEARQLSQVSQSLAFWQWILTEDHGMSDICMCIARDLGAIFIEMARKNT